MRWCPACGSERAPQEQCCAALNTDGIPCGWLLSAEPLRAHGWRPAPLRCAQSQPQAGESEPPPLQAGSEAAAPAPTVIEGWSLCSPVADTPGVRERYRARHQDSGCEAVLTLYHAGAEPDPDVYAAVRRLPRQHVPELLATGRWEERAFEVMEALAGGSLDQLQPGADDCAEVRALLAELGPALHAFAEAGLRHRDLRPAVILVRCAEPLDLVISGFGSARLSACDLDLVAPLESSRYMAPEVLAGVVTAASDWWSLGVLLLERLGASRTLAQEPTAAWLLRVMSRRIELPQTLAPELVLLLRGLLAHDHGQRWQWQEVRAWLAGAAPPAPAAWNQVDGRSDGGVGEPLVLGERAFHSPAQFALAAGTEQHWAQALQLLRNGGLLTWAVQAGLAEPVLLGLRELVQHPQLDDDACLMLALLWLNPDLPLLQRGQIISPVWLLEQPQAGWQLLDGAAPELLARRQPDHWLPRLRLRAARLRERARQRGVALDEAQFRILALCTSRARLAAQWQARLLLLPDSEHPGIAALAERGQLDEEDLIVLLAARIDQFLSAEQVLAQAQEAALRHAIELDPGQARAWLYRGRRALWEEIETRLQGFAACAVAVVDQWADQYRLQHRLPLASALVLLAVPAQRWVRPEQQQYVAQLLGFFEKKVASAALRGPLVRMSVGRGSARVDLCEFDTARRSAATLLEVLLQRSGQLQTLEPALFSADPMLEHRLHALERSRNLYQRDTGIDGLYLGFPFLLWRDPRGHVRTRIVPLLLWPMRLELPPGQRAQVRLGFDSGREEVRLNPALEGVLGQQLRDAWWQLAQGLLQRSALGVAEVMDALAALAPVRERELVALPPLSTELAPGQQQLSCAAVLFHATFMGQAIGEDLRLLQQRSPGGTGLQALLRLGTTAADEATASPAEAVPSEPLARPVELQRFLTAASDPSQEAAVLAAARAPGLVIEGPPGTGKSQTIVNMVADAIGNGRTLLLVCQKHAALEVVHKRLVAEGLGNRVVLLNDVNRDREPTIRVIREQVDALLRDAPADGLAHQREQLAARIEALEGGLDRYHQALHRADPLCGLSWRALLADLIELESGDPPPDFPGLRPQLVGLDLTALARVEEHCAPLLRWWLPARSEGNALAQLRVFTDVASQLAFMQAFEDFERVEVEREQRLASTPNPFDVADPAPCLAWEAAHAGTLLGLRDSQRHQLARWLPLFRADKQASVLLQRLAQLHHTLQMLDHALWHPRLSPALALLPGAQLEALQQLVVQVLAPLPLLAGLHPARWLERARLRRFLRGLGEQSTASMRVRLLDTIRLELAWRPLRAELGALCAQLDLPLPAADSGPQLATQAAVALRLLRESEQLAAVLEQAPDPARADAAALRAERSALERWLAEVRVAITRHGIRQASRQCLDRLDSWLIPAARSCFEQLIDRNASTREPLAALRQAFPTLPAYQAFRARASSLGAAELAVLASLRPLQAVLEQLDPAELEPLCRRLLNREARLGWKQAMEQRHPELLLEGSDLAGRVEQLAQADARMRELNRQWLGQRMEGRIGARSQWEDITRLRGTRTRRLREFLAAGVRIGLMKLRPVWLMNPDVASRVLPLEPALFDVVIYDEASQMPVEFALPTLYRGRIAVVSGDEKQMPPTAFFSSRIQDGDEEEDIDAEVGSVLDEAEREQHWNRREIKDCPDLLQLARTSLDRTTLQIHYRSSYRELIDFSNAAFYDDLLHVPVRHPEAVLRRQLPLEWRQIDGVYQQQANEDEAQAVVQWLAELWQQPFAQRPSVGVVTFNRKQADLIEERMEARAQLDPQFRQAWTEERERQQGGEDMGVFVKNVENVQGDERDVIVFSTTFGRDARGVFRRNFGVLGQSGGERRLNVAVTRARHKLLVISSIPVAEVSDFLATRRAPAGPRDYLQGWLAYARMLGGGEFAAAATLLTRLQRRVQPARNPTQRQDGFSAAVQACIRALGHEPVVVGGADAFALDFAIADPRSGQYVLGIECDSPQHPLLAHARSREIWRPALLRQTIARVHRVHARHWQQDPVGAAEALAAAIQAALQAAEARQPPQADD